MAYKEGYFSRGRISFWHHYKINDKRCNAFYWKNKPNLYLWGGFCRIGITPGVSRGNFVRVFGGIRDSFAHDCSRRRVTQRLTLRRRMTWIDRRRLNEVGAVRTQPQPSARHPRTTNIHTAAQLAPRGNRSRRGQPGPWWSSGARAWACGRKHRTVGRRQSTAAALTTRRTRSPAWTWTSGLNPASVDTGVWTKPSRLGHGHVNKTQPVWTWTSGLNPAGLDTDMWTKPSRHRHGRQD